MIRKASSADLEAILALYAQARSFMAEQGNAGQWGHSYPSQEILEQDIERGELYVNCIDEDGSIACVFMFTMRPEPTYKVIREGEWMNDAPYGTIHRVAASGRGKGAASACIQWCWEQSGGSLRGDTHEKNVIMQHVFEKNGFQRCGMITVADGSPRIAYQKISHAE